jgi:hypothetical protein
MPVRVLRALAGSGICLALAAVLASPGAAACGVERWPVKVAADKNAVLIEDYVRTASVAELGALAGPRDPAARQDTRFLPEEAMVWEISGKLLSIQKMADGDLRLVVTDPYNPPAMVVANAPDPGCARDSRFAQNIRAVRDALDRRFGRVSWATPGVPVTMTGIAYFGVRRSEPGAAPNDIELHPLIGIAFP